MTLKEIISTFSWDHLYTIANTSISEFGTSSHVSFSIKKQVK